MASFTMGSLFSLPMRPAPASMSIKLSEVIDLTGDDDEDSLPIRRHPAPMIVDPTKGDGSGQPGQLRRSKRLQAIANIPKTISRQLYLGQKVTRRERRRQKRAGPELQLLRGHRHLTFWKEKYYKELNIEAEHTLAIQAIRFFEKRTITTVIPDRYLRSTATAKKRAQPRFPGTIEISCDKPMLAARQAYEEHTATKQNVHRLVLWTDGSARKSGQRGFAVAWRRSYVTGWAQWEAAGYKSIGRLLGSAGMEALGVIKALDKACELTRQTPKQLSTVAVYTDSTSALNYARNPKDSSLGTHIVKKARLLRQLGCTTISLHWCPAHSNVPGNELADKIAGIACLHEYGDMAEVVDLSDDDEDDWEQA